ANSQSGNISLNLDFDYQTEKLIYTSDSTFTAFKPILWNSDEEEIASSESLMQSELIQFNSKKSDLYLNPILHYQLFQVGSETLQGFGIGASARYSFANKLSAGFDFAHFSMDYPRYQESHILYSRAVSSQTLADFNNDKIKSQYFSAFI